MKKRNEVFFKAVRYFCLASVFVFGFITIVGTGNDTLSPPSDQATTVTETTATDGSLEFKTSKLQVAGEFEDGEAVDLTITENQTELTLELISPEYTYNSVTGSTGDDLFIFTQKVDPEKYDWKDDTLDEECAECDEEIGVQSLVKVTADQDGLFKPTPKTLTSNDGSTAVIISQMTLVKDITVAVTPYKGYLYIPQYNRINSDIGDQSVTVISGGDINIVDSNGESISAEDACFCGTVKFISTKNLSSLTETQIGESTIALLVYKDKKWQKVNTDVQVNDGTTMTVVSDGATVRLYPFVFVALSGSALETFTLQGHVYDQMSYMGDSEGEYTPVAGASVEVSIPLILDEMTVNNEALTITTGSDNTASYSWGIFDTSSDVATVLPNTGMIGTGENVYTLDTDKQSALSADGQYEVRVQVTSAGMTETQAGFVIKAGDTYTMQINPVPPIYKKTTSEANGFYKIPGLDQSLSSQYAGLAKASGFEDYSFSLFGTPVDGILAFHIYLSPTDYVPEEVTCAGSDTGVTFSPISGCESWLDADQLSGWVSVLHENGYADTDETQPEDVKFPCGTQMTGFGCTIQISCP